MSSDRQGSWCGRRRVGIVNRASGGRIVAMGFSLVVVFGTFACGEESRAEKVGLSGSSSSVDASFFGASGYPEWAATELDLVGFAPYQDRKPTGRYGTVPLDGGETRTLPAPNGEGTLRPLALVGERHTALLLGAQCAGEAKPVPPSSSPPECEPGRLGVYRLDVKAGRWSQLSLPQSLRGVKVRSVSHSQPSAAGWQFVADIGEPDEVSAMAFRINGPTIEEIARDLPNKGARVQYCLTHDAVFTLAASDIAGNTPALPAQIVLTRTQTGSPTSSVPLPPVSVGYAGISVVLACDRDHPYLTTSEPNHNAPAAAVFVLDAGTWKSANDLVPPNAGRAEKGLSSEGGVAFLWSKTGRGGAIAAKPTGGVGTVHDQVGGLPQWKGMTGTLVVPPIPAEDGEPGAPLQVITAW